MNNIRKRNRERIEKRVVIAVSQKCLQSKKLRVFHHRCEMLRLNWQKELVLSKFVWYESLWKKLREFYHRWQNWRLNWEEDMVLSEYVWYEFLWICAGEPLLYNHMTNNHMVEVTTTSSVHDNTAKSFPFPFCQQFAKTENYHTTKHVFVHSVFCTLFSVSKVNVK